MEAFGLNNARNCKKKAQKAKRYAHWQAKQGNSTLQSSVTQEKVRLLKPMRQMWHQSLANITLYARFSLCLQAS